MNGGASCSANSIMVQREKVKKATKAKEKSEKSGGKSRSVNETGSKLSNKQEEANYKSQKI